jgi:transmembrane sensor
MNDLTRMEAAADWLVRLNDAPGDETIVNAWLQWCEEDPENLPAFKRTQAVWQAAALSRDGRVMRGAVRTGLKPWYAVAASFVLGVSGWLWFSTRHVSDPGQQSYSTPIAGRGLTVLADGSRVELGAGSRITTQYSNGIRGVTVDAGEAFFSVMKDAHRPFVVTAGTLRVVAVGTAFDVRRGGDQVVVAVQEGRVRVSNSSGSGPDLAAVGVGEQAVYMEKARHLAVAHIKAADAALWRDGILKYEHEPLSAVAADLNRYSTRKIIITDPTIAQLPFTGTVFSTRIDDALQAFTDVFPLTLVQHSDSIEIHRR